MTRIAAEAVPRPTRHHLAATALCQPLIVVCSLARVRQTITRPAGWRFSDEIIGIRCCARRLAVVTILFSRRPFLGWEANDSASPGIGPFAPAR